MPSRRALLFSVLPVLELDRGAIGFGGLSGLHLAQDLTLTAVSDLGRWLTARLVVEGLVPRALVDVRTGYLRDGAGLPLQGREGDAECLARLPDGTWLVGFERWHRIRAYRSLNGAGDYVEAPPGLEAAPPNGGLESLAVLADGRWLAIAEYLEGPVRGTAMAWLGGPRRWVSMAYRPAQDFAATDACALPDGGALVLERHFSIFGGFSARLMHLPAAMIRAARPGTVLEGRQILSTRDALPPENWEGVSVTRMQGGLVAALVSDDNERSFQRGLVALFPLDLG
ncbi:esterase-like activity of phytase family protein [Plastoroseomonas arctica]|uniref:Esterase-like activity of phytase family protein n=1 Tax=Plastoroseomonas arctica TaxID=1509237 RepID=A0AAF1KMT0_9PROT|nr:esterase-like activity of phytase family protein [Plastoroseomonas arctica]MBR0655889.1 esterase-like activity of phytase family protein [Plastoroseomonas arctica]